MQEAQNEHFQRDFLKFSNFHIARLQNRRFPTKILMKLNICFLKINVSCEASVHFHEMSQKVPRLP